MTKCAAIRIIEPGMLTTVQDLGRTGWSSIGVGRGGAADKFSLRAGNRLMGNDDSAAALEMTLTGGTFLFNCDARIILTGGLVSAKIISGKQSKQLAVWSIIEMKPGDQLQIGPIQSGARTYLCIAGGILVPPLLGSRSTHLNAGFGGFEGRALRAGDTLDVGDDPVAPTNMQSAEFARAFCEETLARRTFRAVEAAHYATFDSKTADSFWTSAFEISMQSDRTGLRLNSRLGLSSLGGRMPSEGMMHGAIQVPQSGEPIVLGVDHPTTGGYPVIACVAAVDHDVLGQLRPMEKIRFERITLAQARELNADRERRFSTGVPPR